MDNKEAKEVTGNDWLDMNTKIHTLKNTRNLQRKAPEDLLENPSDLKAVEGLYLILYTNIRPMPSIIDLNHA